MKKILYFAALLLTMTFATSCEKEKIGGTATEALAGDWYVTIDAADENGNVVEGLEDPFGKGRIHVATFNTAANTADKLYVTDFGDFWGFKVRTNSDVNALTFSTAGAVANESYDCNVTITDGKILPKAGKQNNGSAADSIVFYVSFDDDPYPAAYGYAKYKVSGVRYSGLEEND